MAAFVCKTCCLAAGSSVAGMFCGFTETCEHSSWLAKRLARVSLRKTVFPGSDSFFWSSFTAEGKLFLSGASVCDLITLALTGRGPCGLVISTLCSPSGSKMTKVAWNWNPRAIRSSFAFSCSSWVWHAITKLLSSTWFWMCWACTTGAPHACLWSWKVGLCFWKVCFGGFVSAKRLAHENGWASFCSTVSGTTVFGMCRGLFWFFLAFGLFGFVLAVVCKIFLSLVRTMSSEGMWALCCHTSNSARSVSTRPFFFGFFSPRLALPFVESLPWAYSQSAWTCRLKACTVRSRVLICSFCLLILRVRRLPAPPPLNGQVFKLSM